MARLPSERYLIQQIGGYVVLFEEGSEREIVKFDITDADATAKAQAAIHTSELGDEDKCFAHFWSGYFHAYGTADFIDTVTVFEVGNPDEPPQQFDTREEHNGER